MGSLTLYFSFTACARQTGRIDEERFGSKTESGNLSSFVPFFEINRFIRLITFRGEGGN